MFQDSGLSQNRDRVVLYISCVNNIYLYMLGHLACDTQCVGGGRREVKEKFMDQNQGGGAASKGVGSACGSFRRSIRNFQDTTDAKTTYAATYEFNKRYLSPSSEGSIKYIADESKYNLFAISLFFAILRR